MEPQAQRPRLGAFIGVFTPTVLTILGVIMFMRVGWVVGVAGLGGTIAIVVLANAITFLTALSVSALATNMRVGVGGAYYIISRSLGLEVGGAVGIPLYLSQVLSVTLYCYGLAESFGVSAAWTPTVAGILVFFVTMVASRSIELTLKLQVPVMVLIIAAILSMFVGADWGTYEVADWGPFAEGTTDIGFWGVFAVFFPAVTGILAGVSLSGDLEDPGRSIPVGVLGAVAVGFVVYLVVPVALATSASTDTLLNNSLVWTEVAWLPVLVMPGLWGAILSSAFGSVLGAPRTLQALAEDDVVPSALGRIDPKTGEPTFGLYISGALALVAVFLGDLNTVAEWVTIFFLTTYGALNTVALVEILVNDPSYRPRIRIPWWAAALGGIGCFVAMFAINPIACVVAITVEGIIFWWLRRQSFESEFGDVRTGLILSLAHFLVRLYSDARQEARNWRPTVLVISRDLVADLPAVRMAASFGDTRGMLSVIRVKEQPLDALERPHNTMRDDTAFLHERGITAFCEQNAVPEINDASLAAIYQAHGFGGMNANTVLFPWAGSELGPLEEALRHERYLAHLDKCLLVFRPASGQQDRTRLGHKASIMVWWKGLESNGDLMLLLAHLMTRSERYRHATILLRTVVADREEGAAWKQVADELTDRIRIEVQTEYVVLKPEEQVQDVIRSLSLEASLVLFGLTIAEPGEETAVARRMADLVQGLPDTLLVRNAGPFRGRLI